MSGLWRNDSETPEGKYLVKRRDGTIPEWPYFVIGGKDPAAPAALMAYADKAEELGMDEELVRDVREMANEWIEYQNRHVHDLGDPDAPPHREDDPETIEEMKKANSA